MMVFIFRPCQYISLEYLIPVAVDPLVEVVGQIKPSKHTTIIQNFLRQFQHFELQQIVTY